MTHRLTRPIGNALWISSSGSPMTMQAIYDRIAAQILGHRSFATTERHYIHAKMMAATRRHQQHILRLRHSDEG